MVRQIKPFWALLKTPDETTLVCPSASVPAVFLKVEPGWTAFEVLGPLDFSLTGILAGLSSCLATAGISLFALSTFDTDWILVRESDADRAAAALKSGGYVVV